MNKYETVFILTPVLSDDQMKETVEKFKGVLTKAGAEIISEENWGLKKLAYPIDKKTTGFYELIEFNAAPETIKTLETQVLIPGLGRSSGEGNGYPLQCSCLGNSMSRRA